MDGQLVAPTAARLSVFDRGLWHGDGVFAVLRSVGANLVDGAAHAAMLVAAARWRGLAAPADVLAAATAVATARGGASRIRVLLTAGGDDVTLAPPRLIAIADALPALPAAPIALRTVDAPLAADLGAHKTLAYLDRLRARELARAAGGDDAIRLTVGGDVGETALANLFAVIDGDVVTPAAGSAIRAGVTRDRVCQLAAGLGIQVAIRPLRPRDLARAAEAFVTSAVRGVVAVRDLDGRLLPAPGGTTARLQSAYATFVAQHDSGVPAVAGV